MLSIPWLVVIVVFNTVRWHWIYRLRIDLKMSGASNFRLIFPAVEHEKANWGNEDPEDKEMWNFTFRDQVRGKLKKLSLWFSILL